MNPWDAQAATLDDAKRAVWSDPDWFAGIGRSIEALAPMLEWAAQTRPSSLLDWGCGVGRVTVPVGALLSEHGVDVWGVDSSEQMLTWLGRRCEAGSLPVAGWGTPDQIGRQSGRWGGWSMLTFQHCDPTRLAVDLATMWRITGEGGRWWWQWVDGDYHHGLDHRYPRADMIRLALAAGFRVMDVWQDARQPEHLWMEAHA